MSLAPDGEQLDKDAIGRLGEELAARHLKSRGLKVLHRNYRAVSGGEVDIVCRDRQVLVFVEVKTRTSLEYGRPIEAVTEEKRRLITRGAMQWLRLLDRSNGAVNYRFDVVEVLLTDGGAPQFTVVEAAFETPEPYLYG